MKAQELVDLLQEKIKTYGNLEIYRPLNEGCNHCTISNVGRMRAEDEWDSDSDGNLMPEFFFKIDCE